ncbi:hypothetical protein KC330_g12 [Hortaea werneckii]|nr:hypothetical protein KC330_g12 [Hortaea werneckii]
MVVHWHVSYPSICARRPSDEVLTQFSLLAKPGHHSLTAPPTPSVVSTPRHPEFGRLARHTAAVISTANPRRRHIGAKRPELTMRSLFKLASDTFQVWFTNLQQGPKRRLSSGAKANLLVDSPRAKSCMCVVLHACCAPHSRRGRKSLGSSQPAILPS